MSVFIQIYRDAENGELVLRNVDDTGAVIDTLPQIQIKLLDLEFDDEMGAKFRRAHYTDALDGLKKRCSILATKRASDETDDGHSSSTEDLYFGGGGAVRLMQMISYHQDATHGDYMMCRPDGGNEDGSDDVKVAVEPQLRSSIGSQTMPDSTTWAFSGYVEATQQRTATSGSTTRTEYISPPFLTTDRIPVQSCSNTGVSVSGVAVVLIALTGRQWAGVTS